MTLPVVWLPEADTDLREARTWYANLRSELGERFALAVEATVEGIRLTVPQTGTARSESFLPAFTLALAGAVFAVGTRKAGNWRFLPFS